MRPRTTIIILLIAVSIGSGAIFYFYQAGVRINNKQPVSEQNQLVGQLIPEERQIKASSSMDEIEKNSSAIKPNETSAKKEKRRRAASAVMDQIEKNNNSK